MLVASQEGQVDRRALRAEVEMTRARRVARDGDVVGRERRTRHDVVPVVPSAQAYHAAHAHGVLGVLAHEHEVRKLRVARVAELVEVEIDQQTGGRVGVLASRLHKNLGASDNLVAPHLIRCNRRVGHPFGISGKRLAQSGQNQGKQKIFS